MNNPLFDPRHKIRQAQGDTGVDLDALRTSLDKLHSVPQLQAGLNGKLSRVAPQDERKEVSYEQKKELGIKALAQCVAVSEGDFIDKTMRKIFRDDYIGASYNKRLKMMSTGDDESRAKGIESMRTVLSEYNIEINHVAPEVDYVLPDDVLLYRRLEIKRNGIVRGERVWEWSKQG